MNLPILSLGLLALTSAPETETPVFREGSVAEDVEVMRRILVKQLTEAVTPKPSVSWNYANSAFASGYQTQIMDYTTSVDGSAGASPGVEHSRGFHVPGSGVTYSMDVSVPAHVVQGTAAAKDDDSEAEDDSVWEDTQKAVRGEESESQPSPFAVTSLELAFTNRALVGDFTNVKWNLDEKAVESAIDAVLETIGRHGSKIEGLREDEKITVLLHVTGKRGATPFANAYQNGQVVTDETANQIVWGSYWQGAAGADADGLKRRIVIQVPWRAMLAGKATRLADVKAASLVHSY